MAGQKIKQANIFGRIGSGFGQGLAEQLPKEVARSRLASGLAEIEKESPNLNRLQLMTRLAGVPGGLENPQFIKEYADVARQQNIRNAYQRGGQGRQSQEMINENIQQPQNRLEDIQFGQLNPNQVQRGGVSGDISKEPLIRSDYQNREEQAKDTTNVANENPSASKFVPALAWSQDKFDNKIQEILDAGKADNIQDAMALAEKEQERYMNLPESERRILDYKEGIDEKTDQAFDKEISLLTQKQGADIFSDLPGEFLSDLKKKAREDVATDLKLTPRKAAEKWARIGLDFTKTRNNVDELANLDVFSKLNPLKSEDTLKKLKSASEIYSRVGRSEDFFNKLRSSKQYGGFGTSKEGASLIAYPRSEGLKKSINSFKSEDFGSFKVPASVSKIGEAFGFENKPIITSRKSAKDFLENKKPTDSVLAYSAEMKQKFPLFNERAYLDYLRDNVDKLTPRQENELVKGEGDIFPNWGDLFLFPFFRKSVVHE